MRRVQQKRSFRAGRSRHLRYPVLVARSSPRATGPLRGCNRGRVWHAMDGRDGRAIFGPPEIPVAGVPAVRPDKDRRDSRHWHSTPTLLPPRFFCPANCHSIQLSISPRRNRQIKPFGKHLVGDGRACGPSKRIEQRAFILPCRGRMRYPLPLPHAFRTMAPP